MAIQNRDDVVTDKPMKVKGIPRRNKEIISRTLRTDLEDIKWNSSC